MLQTIFLNVIAVPVVMGVSTAIILNRDVTWAAIAAALIFPLIGAVFLILLDGIPPLPPVRAVNKLPYALAGAGLVFGFFAWRVRQVGAAAAVIATCTLAILVIWWIGRNLLAGSIEKTITVSLLLFVGLATVFLVVRRTSDGHTASNAWPQTFFAVSLSNAAVAMYGGYIGMAMFNGALAAFAGGYLLSTYVSYIRGRETAFSLAPMSTYAWAWTAFTGVVATAILAPQASASALVSIALAFLANAISGHNSQRLRAIPFALRPLLLGLVVGSPALLGIGIAGLQFTY